MADKLQIMRVFNEVVEEQPNQAALDKSIIQAICSSDVLKKRTSWDEKPFEEFAIRVDDAENFCGVSKISAKGETFCSLCRYCVGRKMDDRHIALICFNGDSSLPINNPKPNKKVRKSKAKEELEIDLESQNCAFVVMDYANCTAYRIVNGVKTGSPFKVVFKTIDAWFKEYAPCRYDFAKCSDVCEEYNDACATCKCIAKNCINNCDECGLDECDACDCTKCRAFVSQKEFKKQECRRFETNIIKAFSFLPDAAKEFITKESVTYLQREFSKFSYLYRC